MLGNDQVGDCVIAAMLHYIMAAQANVGKSVTFTTQQALDLYSAITGYNPSDPSTDQGTAWTDALAYWQSTGCCGHKILGWAAVDIFVARCHQARHLDLRRSVDWSSDDTIDGGAVWQGGTLERSIQWQRARRPCRSVARIRQPRPNVHHMGCTAADGPSIAFASGRGICSGLARLAGCTRHVSIPPEPSRTNRRPKSDSRLALVAMPADLQAIRTPQRKNTTAFRGQSC